MDCKRVGLLGIVRTRRVEEWITAFRAEKVQLVIVTLAEVCIVERDKARVNDGCLAMKAVVGKFLVVSETKDTTLVLASHRDSRDDRRLCPATRTS